MNEELELLKEQYEFAKKEIARLKRDKCNCCGQNWNGKKWVGEHMTGCPAYWEEENE